MNTQALIQEAVAQHRQGALGPAEAIYLQVLQAEPANAAALQLLGVLRTQQGRHDEAIGLLGAALASNPTNPGVLINQSTALRGAGRLEEALEHCTRATTLQPGFVEAWFNRGALLSELKRPAEALNCFDQTLKLQPGHSHALYARALALLDLDRAAEALAVFDSLPSPDAAVQASRGMALAKLRRFQEAMRSYDQALAGLSDDAGLHYNRGVALVELARLPEALESYDRALALRPGFAEAWYNRGVTLSALDRQQEALESYDRALALRPALAEAWYNRGVTLSALGRQQQALESLDKAIAFKPRFAVALVQRAALLWQEARIADALASYDGALQAEESDAAWNGRGAALRMLHRMDEALASFDRAVALNPKNAQALSNRADLLWREKQLLEPAIKDLERAVAADPDHPYALGELLHLRLYGADWRDLPQQLARIEGGLREGRKVVRPFVYLAIAEEPAQSLRCSSIFAAEQWPPQPAPSSYAQGHDKLRIGYVSGEFSEQATAHLMAGLYECHDRSRFEIIALDNGKSDNSVLRKRLEAAFDRFVPIAALSDEEAAQKIRAEEIDILVNLNGYFGAHRSGVFARRPAPIQVNYLGFPATLGVPYMDYIIADRTVLPESDQPFYTEKVVYLPDCYQVNDSRRAVHDAAGTRAEHGLPPDGFAFCNFNQSYKLLPETFAAWMRILKAVPGSVLWLLDSQAPFPENLRRAAEQQGVPGERLRFAKFLPLAQHLARLQHADLFLDSLPCNAHTTASDALWSGVPLLTCRGTNFSGRVAASLVQAAGLPEMVVESMADYEARAIALAVDRAALAAIRARLAANRATCPLFDTDLFRRRIEDAYSRMWQLWQAGNGPESFSVAP